MNGKSVILAIEDVLSEAVCTRVLSSLHIDVIQRLGFRGKDYLEKKAQSLNQTAKGFHILMLTDLNSLNACPPQIIQSWIKGKHNPNFFLRVAVMEVESWIMADRKGIADLLSIPVSRIPQDPDSISKPKEFLVSLARLSKRKRLREGIAPSLGSTSKVGPEYNSRLVEFVNNRWNMEAAASISKSLNRTLIRLIHHFSTLSTINSS